MKPPFTSKSVKKLQDVYVCDFYSKQLANIEKALNVIILILLLIALTLIFK